MKVHLQKDVLVMASVEKEAMAHWALNNLIPFAVRACDHLMMYRDQEDSFTKDETKVTCKRCLNKLNRN